MLRQLYARLRALWNWRRKEAELDEEISFHLTEEASERIAARLTADQAQIVAKKDFGNPSVIKDQVRDAWIWPWLQDTSQDLRYAARTLIHNKLFTASVVMTLMLAFGLACVVIAAAARAERSPAVPAAKRLFCFYPFLIKDSRFSLFSYPAYQQLRDLSHDTISLAAVGTRLALTLHLPEQAIRTPVAVVSGNYFTVLGSQPTLGRLLTPRDDVAGAAPVVVLAEDAWEGFFRRDPGIVGQTIHIGSFAYTVVGVTSNPLAGPAYEPDFWVPMSFTAQFLNTDFLNSPTAAWLTFLGRLRAESDPRQVEALLPLATDQLRGTKALPDEWRIEARPVNRMSVGPETHEATARLLFVLTLLTAGFLLAACGNITLLMLTRGAERAHELAVRSALGATTARVVRLFAWETLMLVALGSAMAAVALPWIARLAAMPQLAGLVLTPSMDRYAVIALCVISVSVAAVIVAGTAFGLEVRAKWRGVGLGHGLRVTRPARLRQALVVAQVALACLLLVAAGLLAQSARAVATIPPGFVPDVLVAQVYLPDEYTPEDGIALHRRLRAALLGHASVSSVGLAWHAPLSEMYLSVSVEAPGSMHPERTETAGNFVSPGYFETLGVPVLDGRAFLESDDLAAAPVVIVNRSFAERWWPDGFAVGREIVLPRSGGIRRVVGVVDDLRYRTLTEPLQPLVYIPLTQRYQPWMFVHVRTARNDPMQAFSTVRTVVADLDPRIGVGAARTLEDDVTRSLAEWQGPASLSGLLAFVTLMLTVGGLYATLASSVSQRTKEMAIRRALGAQDRQVRRLVIGQGLLLTAVGLALGLGATAVVMAYLESFMYGVTTRDVSTRLAVIGLVGLVAWLSCRVPAGRAARADPMLALRAE